MRKSKNFVVMKIINFISYAIRDARDHLRCRHQEKLVRRLNEHCEFIVENDKI